ncbi:MAG: hypothetical protein O3C10_00390 [Chloroflexi bacterium]|nr:hypothetical protein [Chloroflexota bacterium]
MPEDGDRDDDDLLLDESGIADIDDDESSEGTDSRPATVARGARAERRRAARARRGAGARNRAAVFSQNLPAELKKLGVMVGGTVIILGVLTVVLR